MSKTSGQVISWSPSGHAEVFGSAAECARYYGCPAASVVKAIEREDGRLLVKSESFQTPVAFVDWLYAGES